MGMIDEEQFSDLYCSDNGRGSKPTADMIGALILKETNDLTYDQTQERMMLDTGWHYALDIAPEDAYVAVRTLKYFTKNVMTSKKHRAAFEDITEKIIRKLEVRTGIQRMDSTHIFSNIRNLTRLGLFVETITQFLRQLREKEEGKYKRVSREIRERYLEREGGDFGDACGSESRRRLEQCAEDAWRLLERYGKSKRVRELDGYRTLKRLFGEQCEVSDEEKIRVREGKEISGDSLQSPYDEGAGYSAHKGKGYQAQVAETCDEKNETQIITHVEVEGADKSDAEATVRVTDSLEEKGMKPDVALEDGTFCSGENTVKLKDKGVELVGPTTGPKAKGKTENIGHFKTTDDYMGVEECPAGYGPVKVTYEKETDTVFAYFDKDTCKRCSLKGQCGAKRKRKSYRLKYQRKKMATHKRRLYQKTEEYKKRYAVRAGIEATNSELKRGHGLGRLRVRGGPAVEFAVYMKSLGCNIKRYVRARLKAIQLPPQTTPMPV